MTVAVHEIRTSGALTFTPPSAVSASSVRLQNFGSEMGIAELEVFDGGANIAPSATATQTSTDPSHPASYANDGDLATYSYTNNSEHPVLDVRLPRDVEVSSVRVRLPWDTATPAVLSLVLRQLQGTDIKCGDVYCSDGMYCMNNATCRGAQRCVAHLFS